MGKDLRLANIYIKIHNKYALTLEDMKFLSQYDPECFEKTCNNIVYKMPEAKTIMRPEDGEDSPPESEEEKPPDASTSYEVPLADRQRIEAVLSKLKQMEREDLPIGEIQVDQVKELLGNLYMELLFPHNDRDTYFDMGGHGDFSVFNKKV